MWKVIMSYIGGCPTDARGNLPTAVACNGENSPDCMNNLSFKIPPEVKDGNATLAWTWFNNVGNREMYMNRATVPGVSGANDTICGQAPCLASIRTLLFTSSLYFYKRGQCVCAD
jgi:hypothetical protein